MNVEQKFALKTRQEIAQDYGIHRDTLRKILKENNFVLPKGLVKPLQQNQIRHILAGNIYSTFPQVPI